MLFEYQMSIDIDQENNTKNKMVLHENIDCVEQYVDESNTGQVKYLSSRVFMLSY